MPWSSQEGKLFLLSPPLTCRIILNFTTQAFGQSQIPRTFSKLNKIVDTAEKKCK